MERSKIFKNGAVITAALLLLLSFSPGVALAQSASTPPASPTPPAGSGSDTSAPASDSGVAGTLQSVAGSLSQLPYCPVGVLADVVGGPNPCKALISAAGSVAGSAASAVGNAALTAMAGLILTIANLLLGIAGTLFNWVVVKTVFQFSSLVGNSPGLLLAWGILRDIGNLVLLFGFIFMGLGVILDLKSFAAKKALPGLIIFAILMNFSLFAAEAVIDSANVLSSVMYAQANDSSCVNLGTTDNTSGTTNCDINVGIAGHIMQSTGLSTVFANVGALSDKPSVLIGLAAFATIGAVVLFSGAIMLAIRAVTLTFLMVMAPIGFAGLAIPALRKPAMDWWNRLLHQAFFAPIFLLLIFISLRIADGFTGTGDNMSLAAALTHEGNAVNFMGVFLVFTLVCGFLMASLVIAKKFGAAGADFATQKAGALTLGSMGWAGRHSAGALSSRANSAIRSSKFGQTRAGRRVALMTEKGATASYDFRGTKAAGSLTKQVGKLGDAQKGGYDGGVKKKMDAYDKYAGTLRQTEEDKKKEAEFNKDKGLVQNSKTQAEEAWKDDRAGLQDDIRDAQRINKTNDSTRAKVRAAQTSKLSEAIAAGDKEAEKREKEKLDIMTKEHEELATSEAEAVEAAKTALNEARKKHEENVKGFNNRIAEIDEKIKGNMDKDIAGVDINSAKRGYAINLVNSRIRTSEKARADFYRKVKKDVNKDKLDQLKDAVDSLGGKTDALKESDRTKLDEVKGEVGKVADAAKAPRDEG